MDCRASEESERPFPGEHEEAEEKIDYLENWDRLDCSIEGFG
jgi:hypothetical protein